MDIRLQRCCICPHNELPDASCPGIPGTLHPIASKCEFVQTYTDQRGWKYKVMPGIGNNAYKARYQKPGKSGIDGWKGVASLPWRNTFDEAQADLNVYAIAKGWKPIDD